MYAYQPAGGQWQLILWDQDIGLGNSFSLGEEAPRFDVLNEPNIARMYDTPALVRAYWRAIQDAVNGPMLPAEYEPVMDGNYAALTANGIKAGEDDIPPPNVTWLASRRAFLIQELATVASPFEISNNGGNDFTNTSASVVLTGRAPVEVKTIQVGGATVTVPLTWPLVTTWNVTVALQLGANNISIQGYDRNGNPLTGYTDSIVITYQP